MRPTILCLLLAMLAALWSAPAAIASDAGVSAVAADVQPTGPVSPGPVATPQPPSVSLPDPLVSPGAALDATRDAYERVGAWGAVLVGLYMLLRAIAMRGLLGLGVGRRAAVAAGVLSVAGAAVDAAVGGGTWIAVLSTALMAGSLVLDALVRTPETPPPGHGART